MKCQEIFFLAELNELDQFIKSFYSALHRLSPIEQQIIQLCYFSLSYEADREIALCLGMDFRQFQAIKEKALYALYSALISTKDHMNDPLYTQTSKAL